MDDLQWVDTASLDLLTHILTDPDSRNILFVGAYRDSEVGPDHPLKKTTCELSQLKVDVQTLHLDELKERDVSRLVRDSFNASSPEVSDLARVLHAKTGGNPLYVTQLLHFLCDEGLIGFEYATGKWCWDLSRIDKEGVAQDLLDLLNARLKALHPNTRIMFATAACIRQYVRRTKAGRSCRDALVRSASVSEVGDRARADYRRRGRSSRVGARLSL